MNPSLFGHEVKLIFRCLLWVGGSGNCSFRKINFGSLVVLKQIKVDEKTTTTKNSYIKQRKNQFKILIRTQKRMVERTRKN